MTESGCLVCRSNEGVERISPGQPVHDAKSWVVEHAYPTSLLGWLVIVLKRHAEALHELSREEGEELGLLQWAVARALSTETGCMKEYAVFFAEQPRFNHVHVHMVPRAPDMDAQQLGGLVFTHLRPDPSAVLDATEVARFCERAGEAIRFELAAVD